MGRKERRAAERAQRRPGDPPVLKPPAPRGTGAGNEILMTPERIQELKNEVVKEAVEQVKTLQEEKGKETAETALDMLLLFGMYYLHRKKGYGRKRLEAYYDGCMELLEEFEQGKCTFKSIRDCLVKETGIPLVEVKDGQGQDERERMH